MPEEAPVMRAVLWGVGCMFMANFLVAGVKERIENPVPWCHVKGFFVKGH
jgi:hypothetical protein